MMEGRCTMRYLIGEAIKLEKDSPSFSGKMKGKKFSHHGMVNQFHAVDNWQTIHVMSPTKGV